MKYTSNERGAPPILVAILSLWSPWSAWRSILRASSTRSLTIPSKLPGGVINQDFQLLHSAALVLLG